MSYWNSSACPVCRINKTLGPQGWIVSQRSFITGARSLNEKDLHNNLAYFKVPEAGMESVRSKLALKIFDEYANTRLNDSMTDRKLKETMTRWTPSQTDPHPPHDLSPSLVAK